MFTKYLRLPSFSLFSSLYFTIQIQIAQPIMRLPSYIGKTEESMRKKLQQLYKRVGMMMVMMMTMMKH